MLWFERQVVTTLVADLDPGRRAAVEEYVEGSLRSMPELLRAGVVAESLGLGAWEWLRRLVRRGDSVRIDALDTNPIGLVRQYVRLLRSLVLYAEHELA